MIHSPNAAQIRAARAMLDWSKLDLARAAGVSISTVKRVEDGENGPAVVAARAAIQGVFVTESISFLADDGDGFGVRLGTQRGHDDR